MTNNIKKCPNCGHVFKPGETYCPNCDLFVPIDEQNNITNDTVNDNTESSKYSKETPSEPTPSIPTFKHRTRLEDDLSEEESEEITEEDKTRDETNESTEVFQESIQSQEPKSSSTDSTEFEEEIETHDEPIQSRVKETQTPLPVEPPKKNNKNKILVGIIVLLIVFGGGYVYNSQKKQNELETTLKLTNSADDAIQNLYMKNQGDVFLKKGITQKDITDAEEKIKEVKGTEQYDKLNERMQHAIKTFARLTAINEAFKKPVIEGNQLISDAYVKDDSKLTVKAIDPEETAFDKLYNEAIKDATDQKTSIKDFTTTLEKLYREDKVVSEPSKQVYNDAVKQLSAIKDPELKDRYQKILDDVSKVIDEQEKQAEAKRKEEEEQVAAAKAEEEKNTQQNNNTNSTQNGSSSTPSTNGGRWGTRQDATIDLSDPAWAWNAGIQEKVIAEVIKRGYVVEGGYTLVPKFIENGVGFYDLYATKNSKLFPNSKPEEFPIYVVTINDKTGWFKGNGPN
ncbi:cell division site-positioning protein MapZ family protein [Vagococcus sp. JNUCC 83]